MIRIWLPGPSTAETDDAAGASLVRLHGFVEHVGAGRSSAFRGLDELEALLLSAVRRDREAADREPDPVWGGR